MEQELCEKCGHPKIQHDKLKKFEDGEAPPPFDRACQMEGCGCDKYGSA